MHAYIYMYLNSHHLVNNYLYRHKFVLCIGMYFSDLNFTHFMFCHVHVCTVYLVEPTNDGRKICPPVTHQSRRLFLHGGWGHASSHSLSYQTSAHAHIELSPSPSPSFQTTGQGLATILLMMMMMMIVGGPHG